MQLQTARFRIVLAGVEAARRLDCLHTQEEILKKDGKQELFRPPKIIRIFLKWIHSNYDR